MISFQFQDVARGLSELLAYEGNVEEDMCMSFQVRYQNITIKYGNIQVPVGNVA